MSNAILAAYLVAMGSADALQDPIYTLTESPTQHEAGAFSFGVFDQVRIGISDRIELGFTGLTSLTGPDPALRYILKSNDKHALSITAGMSIPTYGLRLMQGTVLTSDQVIPWVLIPGLGFNSSHHTDTFDWSVGALTRFGVPLSAVEDGERAFTQTDMAWLDPMTAPMTDGYSVALLASIEHRPTTTTRLVVNTRAQWGAGLDLNARIIGWLSVGKLSEIGVGGVVARETFGYGPDWRAAPRVDWRWHF
jgi:hypothetical protein